MEFEEDVPGLLTSGDGELPQNWETENGSHSQRTGHAPLSFAQRRIWFFEQWNPGTPTYNISSAHRIEGELRPTVLRDAFTRVVQRHGALRTSFSVHRGEPRQTVRDDAGFPFLVHDLSTTTTPDEEALRQAEQEARRPIRLTDDPPLRVLLLRCAEQRWLLVLTIHHIVCDGHSVGLVLDEVSETYEALESAHLEPPPCPRLDQIGVAEKEIERWSAGHLDDQVRYWQRRLAGGPEHSAPPPDHPRPPLQTFAGRTHIAPLPPRLMERVTEAAQAAATTPYAVLLSAFSVFLGRYSNQDDVIVGAPFSTRDPATDSTVGLLVNILPLRLTLSEGDLFRDLACRAHAAVLEALENRDVPFERLMASLEVERDLSHSPLIQILFGMDSEGRHGRRLAGTPLTQVFVERATAKFDMTWLVVGEDPHHIEIEYNTDLYEHSTVRRMADDFVRLLGRLLDRPDAHAVTEEFVDADVLARLNAGAARMALDDGDCVPARIARRAAECPDAPAIHEGKQWISYGELDERSNRLGHALRAWGVGPERIVGVYQERGIDLVTTLLAVLKAGGAYLPLDPAHPTERTRFMLSDSGAELVVATPGLAGRLPRGDWSVLETDGSAAKGTEMLPPPALDDLAYLIYTSGSTGTPKGVQATHRNLARLFPATGLWFDFDASDVWTWVHSPSFDFSAWEIWGALVHGARLVVVPKEVTRSPEDLHALLRARQVTVLSLTPSAFRNLVTVDAAGGHPSEASPDLALRYVVLGGESVDMTSVGRWFGAHGDQSPQVANLYGITETTVHATCRILRADDVAGNGSPIGEPLSDLSIEVVDRWGNTCPALAPGEIHVHGDGVTRGYLGRPALTAERFPPARSGGPRHSYRSGDLARLTPGGELEYIGRDDHQVKIRGFRVEPGEIEAVLGAHPEISGAVVLARPDEGERPARLAAYVASDRQLTTSEVRAFLSETLPEHMLPAAVVRIDEWPLTYNGKIDRDALPAPDTRRPRLSSEFVGPRDGVEEALADVFQRVLQTDRVGVHDSFFDLGGDSIRSLQIIGLAKEHGFSLRLQDLFQRPTIAELRQCVAKRTESVGPADRAPFSLLSEEDRRIVPEGMVDAYPLSMLQAGMVFHMELEPESLPYHNVNSFHVRAPYHADMFRRAVADVMARHPILRTSFDLSRYSVPMQLVWESVPPPVTAEDIRHLDVEAQRDHLLAVLRTERAHPFDIGRAPLIRFALHRRTDSTMQWTVTEHHAILDGWSLFSTQTEILRRYLDLLRNPDTPRKATPESQYRDFIRLEREALISSDSARFWRERLAGFRPARLPAPAPETAGFSPRLGDTHIEGDSVDGIRQWRSTVTRSASHRSLEALLPEALCASLGDLAARTGVPLKSVLLAAHLKVLSLATGSPDVIAGVSSHGRPEEPGATEARGLYLNLLPLRLTLTPAPWSDLVRAVFHAERELLPHRRYPLARIQQDLGVELFDNTFLYNHFHMLQNVIGPDIEFIDARINATTEYRAEPTSHSLSTGFMRHPNSELLLLRFDYHTGKLSDDTAELLRRCYLEVLQAMTRDSDPHHEFEPSRSTGAPP
ncbi:amino acid adenylation domain-containing protein [Spinactinospora alkalitolerans]|uniref:Amino acid adenylation domain-containing protein n=1 Tax=Spinactinospora alkalitolerans TaxID=687207 RepID=A0A852U1H0_9ACTN|nr:non-ribosomal peptide synthetase [Spinactinospora alkalitolerans]NYE48014.1 amino acid adenylation domain-containing protein [Spinactinospora alkalitolerans]